MRSCVLISKEWARSFLISLYIFNCLCKYTLQGGCLYTKYELLCIYVIPIIQVTKRGNDMVDYATYDLMSLLCYVSPLLNHPFSHF